MWLPFHCKNIQCGTHKHTQRHTQPQTQTYRNTHTGSKVETQKNDETWQDWF